MNQLENCQARYRSNTWMGRTRTDGPDEFEPTKFDCNYRKIHQKHQVESFVKKCCSFFFPHIEKFKRKLREQVYLKSIFHVSYLCGSTLTRTVNII